MFTLGKNQAESGGSKRSRVQNLLNVGDLDTPQVSPDSDAISVASAAADLLKFSGVASPDFGLGPLHE